MPPEPEGSGRMHRWRGSAWRTVSLALRLKSRAVRVYPRVSTSVGEGARVQGDGRLELGAPWPGLPCLTGGLRLGRRAVLELNGGMTMHTGFQVSVADDAVLSLGSGYINSGLRLDCFTSIRIGFSVAIGPEVLMRDSDNHKLDDRPMSAPVVIGDRVWIGARAMILKGVTIGNGAVIAAGSVVSRDIPPGALAAGVPARVIRENVTWR